MSASVLRFLGRAMVVVGKRRWCTGFPLRPRRGSPCAPPYPRRCCLYRDNVPSNGNERCPREYQVDARALCLHAPGPLLIMIRLQPGPKGGHRIDEGGSVERSSGVHLQLACFRVCRTEGRSSQSTRLCTPSWARWESSWGVALAFTCWTP